MKHKKLKILFRTSGGRAVKKQLGMGHVNRCLSLSEVLHDNKLFFLVEDYGGIKKFFGRKKIKNIIELKKDLALSSDIFETKKQIIKKNIDILIVDKYNLKIRYLLALKKFVKIIVITDLKKIDYPCDLVVNGFLGFSNQLIKNKYGTNCLVGPRFQILNKKFENEYNGEKKTYDLLVSFGGFDEKNLVEKSLKILLNLRKKLRIKIILGPSTLKSTKIKKLVKKFGNNLILENEVTDMKREITKTKFGLCSGGITAYEFATMKVPFAIICQVQHQLISARLWQKYGYARNLGLVSKSTGSKLHKFLEDLDTIRFKPIKKIHALDGKGVFRIAEKIISLND